ncbi:hypothetical protein VNI00_001087 [Paramarasmius palmivorus]|uniref:Uncharacterized protein n=1 Tax=Paramarasmius palmivorus TaxID=297713 RepID=A0AAW0E8Y3_9AGAR
MHTLRRFKATVLGHDTSVDSIKAQLGQGGIPITEADCRSCSDPCEEGHEPYPGRFDVDMETQMLGSVKPYHRQVLSPHISTTCIQSASTPIPPPPSSDKPLVPISGVFTPSDSSKLAILNGSHHSLSDNPDVDTILVFPDYKIISEVPRSLEGAQAFWNYLSTPDSEKGAGTLKSWVIPYSCVILLCSHKRRDNRCSIAAAKLGHAFTHSLEHSGWTVDTEIEHPTQESPGPEDLQQLATQKKALLLRNSHTGGHKFAGNCIIYTPQGSGIWYGRVTTHEVDAIVSQTIEKGLILPPLLRGGINIARPGCKSLHDW